MIPSYLAVWWCILVSRADFSSSANPWSVGVFQYCVLGSDFRLIVPSVQSYLYPQPLLTPIYWWLKFIFLAQICARSRPIYPGFCCCLFVYFTILPLGHLNVTQNLACSNWILFVPFFALVPCFFLFSSMVLLFT